MSHRPLQLNELDRELKVRHTVRAFTAEKGILCVNSDL